MLVLSDKKIFIASKPIDFRMSIDGISSLIQNYLGFKSWIHDGSIYVFYNRSQNKIKCLFWDKNGFVLYYKRLEGTKFKVNNLKEDIQNLTIEQLDSLLLGLDPVNTVNKNILQQVS